MIQLNELLKEQLAFYGQLNSVSMTNEEVIKDLIRDHNTREMRDGVSYYQSRNVGVHHKQRYYLNNGVKVTDETKVNNRLSHAFHKMLVDQKVGYLVSKPMAFSAVDKNYEKQINTLLNDKWDDAINELVKNSSNKGVEYLHTYIDVDGSFKYRIIPAEGIIPIYDTETERDLVAVIRYYTLVDYDNRKYIKAEYWDDETVTFYIQDPGGEFKLDVSEPENPASHFKFNGQGYGWGKVPFVEFRNNEEKIPDLQFYKTLVDEYDLKVSELADNLHELQHLIYVVKNYDGTDLKEFMEGLRFFKAAKVGTDGGIETLKSELPIATLDSHLDRLEENIFLGGQGINMKTDTFGSNPSGVALKFLYQPLDFKCGTLERKFKAAIRELLWFATEYIAITNQGKYDYQTVNVTFNKTIISNQKETVDMAVSSAGIISNETIVANHPWTVDVQVEMERLKKEQQDNQIRQAELMKAQAQTQTQTPTVQTQDNQVQTKQ